jgi:PAS domain S-box-containing protein
VAKRKVLIVDDSPVELKLTTKILAQAGYETVVATNGPQALRLARESRPDLVILDVNMPQMDGYEVCQELKQDPATRDIPVVLYSVRDQVIDVLKGLEVGAEDFITKGMWKEEVLDRLRNLFPEEGMRDRITMPIDFSQLDKAASYPDGERIARLLVTMFNREVRQRINILFGVRPTYMLIERAARRASEKYDIFAPAAEATSDVYPFRLEAIRQTPTDILLAGFKEFVRELVRAFSKLSGTRIYGPREVSDVTQAFKQMLRRFEEAYAELERAWREETERQKESTEHRPSAATPSVKETVFHLVVDDNGAILNCDASGAELLGYSRAEVIGQPLLSLVTDSSRSTMEQLLRQAKEHGAAAGDLDLQTRHRSTVACRLEIAGLYDTSGRFVLSQLTVRVIPPDGQLQRRLSQYEELIADLRLQLAHAHAEVKRAEEEFESFIHIVSHDLRQPLQVIMNLAQLLEEECAADLSETGREYLITMQQFVGRLRDMITDLVKLSRTTVRSLQYETVDLEQLVEEIRESLRDQIAERQVIFTISGPLPTVRCDPAGLRLVFLNLIDNAIKFNDKPQPVVEVGLVPEDPNFHTFYVRDNGLGIDPKNFEKIFQIFQRLHDDQRYTGRGVGLTFSRRIIEAHGGRIWVESNLGAGSTFYFTLPA